MQLNHGIQLHRMAEAAKKTPIFFSIDAFYTMQHCFAKRLELSYDSNHYEISINAGKVWSIPSAA